MISRARCHGFRSYAARGASACSSLSQSFHLIIFARLFSKRRCRNSPTRRCANMNSRTSPAAPLCLVVFLKSVLIRFGWRLKRSLRSSRYCKKCLVFSEKSGLEQLQRMALYLMVSRLKQGTKPMPANSEKVDILVVDDRPDKLLALEAILEPLNENIVKASSGGQALRLLLKHDFAVLLLDVQMPDIDGFQTAELIRQNDRTKNLPILFVSAFDATNDKLRKVYALGAVDYIPTPGAPDALRAKVSVFVELYRKNRALQKLVQESNAK